MTHFPTQVRALPGAAGRDVCGGRCFSNGWLGLDLGADAQPIPFYGDPGAAGLDVTLMETFRHD